ncbi:DUF3822 family protein [Formosa sp. S-31]|uniref:DUF3822 family protein n=1 Tax=Formosa sp. S-31 TaxID=2790949 RepID=UPI003EBE5EC4
METTNNTKQTIKHLELSIQISLSGLSFSVLNRSTKEVFTHKRIQFKTPENPFRLLDHIQTLFNTEEVLKQDFAAVQVIHCNELSTLVPKALFSEDHLGDYLKFNSKILKTDFITFDVLESNDAVNVYVPYVNINNFVYDHFGSFTFKHYSTVLIESILQLEKNNKVPKLYVHIDKRHFEIVSVNNGVLQFYNTFEYNTKEDFIYYLLFTIEQLKLNPETIDLVFVGAILKHDDLYNMAYTYIRHVSFGKLNNNFTFKQQPQTQHAEFILLNSF